MLATVLFIFAAATSAVPAMASRGGSAVSPIQKVLELLSALEAKVIAQGEKSQSVYEEFAQWCEERSRSLRAEIKKTKSQEASLQAVIDQAAFRISALGTKIEDTSTEIYALEKELKTATALREKEASIFSEFEDGLTHTIDTTQRAIAILEKELEGSSGASLVQRQSAWDTVQALVTVVDGYGLHDLGFDEAAASFSQTSEGERDEDQDGDLSLDAPDPAAYEKKSGSIVTTLEALLDKATSKLAEGRTAEAKKANSYGLLKQTLETKIHFFGKELESTKADLAENGEQKALAEGKVKKSTEELQESAKALEEYHQHCMTQASEFEEEVRTRSEELEAVKQAQKIIRESIGGAEKATYSLAQDGSGMDAPVPSPTPAPEGDDIAASFLQMAGSTQSDAFAVAAHLRKLAVARKSKSLMQLFRYTESILRSKQSSNQDPFVKVREMVSNMISKLEDQQNKEASKHKYCDREMASTKVKMADKADDLSKVSTKLDQFDSQASSLTQEMSSLQQELQELAASQQKMESIRSKQKEIFQVTEKELDQGLQAVRAAIRVLRDYYAKGEDEDSNKAGSDSTSSGVIGLLQVIESDFSKNILAITNEEENAEASYEADSQEAALAKAEKEKGVSMKQTLMKSVVRDSAGLSSDKDNLQSEADAVNEYFSKLQSECLAKADSYEKVAARRKKEIEDLEEAMRMLDGKAASFNQQDSSKRHQLRGHSA